MSTLTPPATPAAATSDASIGSPAHADVRHGWAAPFGRAAVRQINAALDAYAVGGSGRPLYGVCFDHERVRISRVRTVHGISEGRMLGGGWAALREVILL